jgi:hypothetical protein
MKESFEEKYVYHGSPKEFDSDVAIPKRNIRSRINETGEEIVIFDQESFHATPHKWIVIAYTYKSAPYKIDGKTAHYNMGVSLYENNNEVVIYGFHSLEESLKTLYGNGGYVYHFEKDKFIYKEGLGNLEVIVTEPTSPVTVERVEDPVKEMKKLGVTFRFIDLGLPENENKRNYF